jgi:amidase
MWSCLGAWIESAAPELSPKARKFFDLIKNVDRSKVGEATRTRERYFRRLESFLGRQDLLCFPTVPAPARFKGGARVAQTGQPKTNYYPRALSLSSIAGLGRLPEVSLPLAQVGGVPAGLSLLAAHGRDAYLLGVVLLVADMAGNLLGGHCPPPPGSGTQGAPYWGKGPGADGPCPFPQTPIPNLVQGVGRGV